MKQYGVRPSIRLSQHGLQQQTPCCRFPAVGMAVRRYRPVIGAVTAAGECGQSHVVSVRR